MLVNRCRSSSILMCADKDLPSCEVRREKDLPGCEVRREKDLPGCEVRREKDPICGLGLQLAK